MPPLFALCAQFALEALVVPADHPTAPSEVARLLPAPIKLLRTLKFCEDATDEPRTQVRQTCGVPGSWARWVSCVRQRSTWPGPADCLPAWPGLACSLCHSPCTHVRSRATRHALPLPCVCRRRTSCATWPWHRCA